MAGALGSKSKGGVMPPAQSSARQTFGEGGIGADKGNRPGDGGHMIDTSAPSDAHTLGRAPKGWLK